MRMRLATGKFESRGGIAQRPEWSATQMRGKSSESQLVYFCCTDLLAQWLCLTDARQVFDLPGNLVLILFGSLTRGGHRPQDLEEIRRQVEELPRIGVAKPWLR